MKILIAVCTLMVFSGVLGDETPPPPPPCTHSEWSPWTSCSKTCDEGEVSRDIHCLEEPDMKPSTQTSGCNMNPCDDAFKDSVWTECSEPCGGGFRTLSAIVNGQVETRTIDCNTQKCFAPNMTCSDSDIVVVLDSSGTIGDSWPILKQFTIDLINALMMRDSLIRVGIVAYAYQVHHVIPLHNIYNAENITEEIWRMSLETGATHTSEAIEVMTQQFIDNGNPVHSKLGIVISDGKSNINSEDTLPYASIAKHVHDIKMLSIGVKDYFIPEMRGIASEPKSDFLYSVDDYTSLNKIINTVANNTCSDKKECSACEIKECVGECFEMGVFKQEKMCYEIDRHTLELKNITYIECPAQIPCYKWCPNVPDCEQCDFTKGQVWRQDIHNCHRYFVCERQYNATDYSYHHMTCGENYWNQELLTCTTEESGNCKTRAVVTAAPVVDTGSECPLSVYALDETRYWILGKEDTIRECPNGLFFDDVDSCGCVLRSGVIVATNGCDDDLLLHFPYEKDFNDVSCHKAQADVYGDVTLVNDPSKGGMACFSGSSYLEVPFLRNYFAGRNVEEFTIEMDVLFANSGVQGIAGMVNNGDCKSRSTFEVSSMVQADGSSNVFADIITDLSGEKRSSATSAVPGMWKKITMVYNGSTMRVYQNGILFSSTPVTGGITNSHNPMRIGTICEDEDNVEHYFTGCIEDLKLWNKVF